MEKYYSDSSLKHRI